VVGAFPDEIAGWKSVERPYPVALFEYFNPLQRPASTFRRAMQNPNERLFSPVDGVFHQQLFEERIPRPFELVACGGYHLSALGAASAAVFPAGKDEIAAGEKIWMTVPKVYQIVLSGKLPAGCTVTDLALSLQNQIPAGWDSTGVVELMGEGVDALSPEQRFNLANLAGELPFQTAIVATQKPLMEHPFLGGWEVSRLEVNLSKIEPQIFRHPGNNSGEALSAHLGRPVERVLIGGCQNGCLEDLELAAKLLEDRATAPGVELSILPGSRTVYRKALRKGILDALMAAGAIIYPPGSYPVSWDGRIFATMDKACLDYVKPEDVVSGSFLVGVASALTGQLTDPKTLFR
jgi:homoaconitase/3-isopropylmalate dehydratase large subunit